MFYLHCHISVHNLNILLYRFHCILLGIVIIQVKILSIFKTTAYINFNFSQSRKLSFMGKFQI